MIGHISRDATAIEAREKPLTAELPKKRKRKRGRPRTFRLLSSTFTVTLTGTGLPAGVTLGTDSATGTIEDVSRESI